MMQCASPADRKVVEGFVHGMHLCFLQPVLLHGELWYP